MHACVLVGHVFWWVTGEHDVLNIRAGPQTAQSWVLLEIMPDSVAMHASVPRWFRAPSFGTVPTVAISRSNAIPAIWGHRPTFDQLRPLDLG